MTVNKGAKTLAKLKDMVSDKVLENFEFRSSNAHSHTFMNHDFQLQNDIQSRILPRRRFEPRAVSGKQLYEYNYTVEK